MDNRTLQERVLQVTERFARKVFAAHPDKEALVNDSMSLAWQALATAPPRATPSQVANFAVRRAKAGRQFRQSVRSIDHPTRPRGAKRKALRSDFDVADLADKRPNPAEIVQVKMDWETWWLGLTDRQRQVGNMLATGWTTGEVAEYLGVSEGAVSQFRSRLKFKWDVFQEV